MKALAKHGGQLSLAERVRAKLVDNGSLPPGRALLLDVSGSMAEDCGDGRSKIEALREVARDIACPATWAFADAPFRVTSTYSLAPGGNTMMGLAIETVRRAGVSHIALITDGLPTDPDRALRTVAGLRLDIFYVGPQPAPAFLAQLARAAAAGSSSQSGSLMQCKQLSQNVRQVLMLNAGKDTMR